MQIANNTPIWARLYYLLRIGASSDALSFATENESALSALEKSFLPYLKAYLDSPARRLPKLLRDRFLAEYNQRIRYLSDTSDPYKHALYKLIGRVEINRRNVPGVTQTTEDWLWFQLSLVREPEGGMGVAEEAPHEKYGLRDLAAVLRKFGEQHFDPKGTRPLLYFQVLLLSGQFERVRRLFPSAARLPSFLFLLRTDEGPLCAGRCFPQPASVVPGRCGPLRHRACVLWLVEGAGREWQGERARIA